MPRLLPLFRYATPAARRAVARLARRMEAQEALDSAAYRARVKAAFGRVLRPPEVVARILADVRTKGDRALFDYAWRIDGVRLTRANVRVSDAERKAAFRRTAPELREALLLAAHRIAEYQQRIMPADAPPAPGCCEPRGVRTGLAWSPLRRVGLCVPGATAAYPSSLLMAAIPALVAGVQEIAVVSPCGRDGRLNDGVLCACELLGLKEIYRVGGAQAIGALAYGTASVPHVDKIAGPGNLFVMLAKRAVFGRVDIDMLAGPSEVLIIADSKARPDWIAADLLAQAEHDPLCACVLLTPSAALARAVRAQVSRQLADLPRAAIAAAALRDWGLALVVKDLDEAVRVANELAPEHVEILTKRPRPEALARKIVSAGAIFLGPHAPEPLGDYLAGPSHTLPTGGTARAFSGISVYTFLRRTSLIAASPAGLRAVGGAIGTLARAEGLEAHRRSVAARFKK